MRLLSLPFPRQKVSRLRFVVAWVLILLGMWVGVILIPNGPHWLGMEYQPLFAELMPKIGMSLFWLMYLSLHWHLWWRIADTKANKGATWFWFIVASLVPLVAIAWYFLPPYQGYSEWPAKSDAD